MGTPKTQRDQDHTAGKWKVRAVSLKPPLSGSGTHVLIIRNWNHIKEVSHALLGPQGDFGTHGFSGSSSDQKRHFLLAQQVPHKNWERASSPLPSWSFLPSLPPSFLFFASFLLRQGLGCPGTRSVPGWPRTQRSSCLCAS